MSLEVSIIDLFQIAYLESSRGTAFTTNLTSKSLGMLKKIENATTGST